MVLKCQAISTIMITWLLLQCRIVHITWHSYYITAIWWSYVKQVTCYRMDKLVIVTHTQTQKQMQARTIDQSHKSHNAPVPYPAMHHFVTEMCTCVHISATIWCIIVGYVSDALWGLWDWSIPKGQNWKNCNLLTHVHENLKSCSQVNATEHLGWEVNIGSSNGLVPSGNKSVLEPMLTRVGVKNVLVFVSFQAAYLYFTGRTTYLYLIKKSVSIFVSTLMLTQIKVATIKSLI